MKRILFATMVVLTAGLPARSVVEANGGGVHIGDLSDTASYALIGVGLAVVGLFVFMFVLRWRQAAQSRRDDPEDASEAESQDEG